MSERAKRIEEAARALLDASLTVMWSRHGGRCIYCGSGQDEGHRTEPPYICGLASAVRRIDAALAMVEDAPRQTVGYTESGERVSVGFGGDAPDLDLSETRPCVCGCRRSKHLGEGVNGKCSDCMGHCKKYVPVDAPPPAPGAAPATKEEPIRCTLPVHPHGGPCRWNRDPYAYEKRPAAHAGTDAPPATEGATKEET